VAQRLLLVLVLIVSPQLSGCSRLFFFPQHVLLRTPADVGLRYEEVHFSSSDGIRLHGWFLPAEGQAKGTVVFLHGNAENISTHFGAVYWLPARGFHVLVFDYRGFGRSAGKPDIAGAQHDAVAALYYAVSRYDVDAERLVLFGQSIGGAIALYTAATADIPVRAVVAESAFASYPGIMREKMAGALPTWPFQWMALGVTDRYDPIAVIGTIRSTAILLIHGDADPIIPVEHAHRLYAAARGDKRLWVLENTGHIGAFAPRRTDVRQRFVEYLERVLTAQPE